jgi:hypothetical protein
VSGRSNEPLEIKPIVDENFQMENEENGGDWKRMKTGN